MYTRCRATLAFTKWAGHPIHVGRGPGKVFTLKIRTSSASEIFPESASNFTTFPDPKKYKTGTGRIRIRRNRNRIKSDNFLGRLALAQGCLLLSIFSVTQCSPTSTPALTIVKPGKINTVRVAPAFRLQSDYGYLDKVRKIQNRVYLVLHTYTYLFEELRPPLRKLNKPNQESK
ncbi:hypothetical protein C8R43DRAFT_960291 [Mycena crocata]|nr:hypothetical protein C8R43DRAFT_960291 [Mycena crocata]